MDSALEVAMNLVDPSSITDVMGAVWSADLAKKYHHLPWVLLNKPFEVEMLTAVDVLLLAPVALQ
uniref:Uncharacterized protein n=1 Tax=Romanomermis culicivorax TaxID=13658 RepID=A0A915KZP5_ROMCU